MDRRYGLAEDLVDAIAKEATGQVAKGVVGAVKVAVAAAAVAIGALAHALWSSSPLATVALLVLSFLLGLAIGIAFGWRRACKVKNERLVAKEDEIAAKNAEIAELKKRPTLKDVDELKKEHAKAIADRSARISELEQRPTQKDMDELKSAHAEEIAARGAEIERLRSPVEAVRRAISGLPVNELAMVGTLRNGPLKTSGFVGILSHLASLGIAEKLKVSGVFTPTWGLTPLAIDALGEDELLSKSAAAAAAGGVRDVEAERYISSLISKLPEEQLGAVFIMHEQGFFDYRAVDRDPWSYEHDQGADDLEELRSAGIAEYRTLGNGMRRWTLTERAARVVEDDPTLVDEGRKYFESVVGENES